MTKRVSLGRGPALVLALLAGVALVAAACGGPAHPETDEVARAGGSAAGGVSAEATTALHHWQALTAINEGDADEALHHVEHIIGAVEGAHLAAMQGVAAALRAGDLHDAEHEIGLMLAGQAELNLSPDLLHLQMALDAVAATAFDEAEHHMTHFLATAAGADRAEGEAVLAALDEGHNAEARTTIERVLRAAAARVEPAEPVEAHEADHDAAVHDADADHDDAAAHDNDAAAAGRDDDHDEADDAHTEALPAGIDGEHARTIVVEATEFAFGPSEIHVKVGETVRLVLENHGAVLHDITAEVFEGEAQAAGAAMHEHQAGMAMAMFHTAANAGETSELFFVASEAGEYALFCSVPGHAQLGMTAVLIVEP